jgi:hypothetical protein
MFLHNVTAKQYIYKELQGANPEELYIDCWLPACLDRFLVGLVYSADDLLSLVPGVWVGGLFLLESLESSEPYPLIVSCEIHWNSRKKVN